MGAWRAELDRLLLENEARPRRERLTLLWVFEALRGYGYEGGYDAVRRYARGERHAAAFAPLSLAAGEAYQLDWSHEVVLVGGTTVTVKVAQLRFCHSRIMFVRASPRETVFHAHDNTRLHVEVRHLQRVVHDELPPRLHHVAHEG